MAVRKKTTSAIVAASLLIIALCAAMFAAVAPSAKADGVICLNKDELGAGFGPYNWKTFTMIPLPDAPNRVWTLQESFGGSAHFVNYEGEGKGDHTFVRDVGEDRGKGQPQWSKNIDKLKSERSIQKCTMDNAMVHIGDFYLRVANTLTAFTTFVATKSFDPSFICRESGQGGCIDILSVIGGKSGGVVTDGRGGGIVGALTAGLYLPLIILVVAISAFVVIRQGIIHHQIRTALGSTLWILGCMTQKEYAKSAGLVNVEIESLKCTPTKTDGVGVKTQCIVKWKFGHVPGSPLGFVKTEKGLAGTRNTTVGTSESEVNMTGIQLVPRSSV